MGPVVNHILLNKHNATFVVIAVSITVWFIMVAIFVLSFLLANIMMDEVSRMANSNSNRLLEIEEHYILKISL